MRIALEIADDLKRRVSERRRVGHQLLVRGVKVFVSAFVFPGEIILFPDIGIAFTAANFGSRLFEGEIVARRDRVLPALDDRTTGTDR